MGCADGAMRKPNFVKRLDFSKLKTHSIRGKSFRLIWKKPRNTCPNTKTHEVVGLCDDPSTRGKELWVWPKQDFYDLIETTFHEVIHGGNPDLSEDAVNDTAHAAVLLLKRMGLQGRFVPPK